MMVGPTDFAVWMNDVIYAHLFMAHGWLIARLFYMRFFFPEKHKYRRWIPRFIVNYLIYALFHIPFFIWYYHFYGNFWYYSHLIAIHHHMYGVAMIITTFIYHKELNLEVKVAFYYALIYFLYICGTGCLMYAVVNGCDEGEWKGWMEEDLYRFNDIPLGSIDWRKNPPSG